MSFLSHSQFSDLDHTLQAVEHRVHDFGPESKSDSRRPIELIANFYACGTADASCITPTRKTRHFRYFLYNINEEIEKIHILILNLKF